MEGISTNSKTIIKGKEASSSKRYETRSRTNEPSKVNEKFEEFKKKLDKKKLKETPSKPERDKKKPSKTEIDKKKLKETPSNRSKKKPSKTEAKIKNAEKDKKKLGKSNSNQQEEQDNWYRKRPQLRQTTLEEVVTNKKLKQNETKKKLKPHDENHNSYKAKKTQLNKTLTPEEEEKQFKKRMEEADYKKYGKKTPSFDEIVKFNKELETYKKDVASACEFVAQSKLRTVPTLRRKSRIKQLDCKHLSLKEVEEHFKENKAFCRNVIEGVSSSERHERYQHFWPHCTSLTYNTSMVTFSSEQIQCLAKLCERKFKNCRTEYFFMVLMPELCLKIFCDQHKMSPEEGAEYLEKRPIDF